MRYDFLFNKDDTLTLAVIHQLNNAPTNTVTRNDLISQYELTTYQLNKLFTAINAAFKAVGGEPPCYIEESTKDLWQAHHLNTFVVQQATLYLLEQSASFKAFTYYFLYSKQTTTTAFAKDHYLTAAVFFRQTSTLKHRFGDNPGRASSEHSEFALRQYLFQLFYELYTGVKAPFPELDGKIAPLLAACTATIGHDLLPTQQVKLTTFLKVSWLRRQNGDALPAVPTPFQATGYSTLEAAVADSDAEDLTPGELDYLYQFLVTQRFLTLPATELPGLFPRADELTRQFIADVAQSNQVNLTGDTIEALTTRLMPVHIRLTTAFLEPTTFIDASQITFFADLYPAFDAIIQQFLGQLDERPDLKLSANRRINLYFSEMFALISAVPQTALRRTVNICVDFSEGTLYSEYVTMTLRAFSHANICVAHQLTAETDIYIADFRAPSLKLPQVIWQNPPTPHDWTELADLILTFTRTNAGLKGGGADV